MTGLGAFENHLPYQKYQGSAIVVRYVDKFCLCVSFYLFGLGIRAIQMETYIFSINFLWVLFWLNQSGESSNWLFLSFKKNQMRFYKRCCPIALSGDTIKHHNLAKNPTQICYASIKQYSAGFPDSGPWRLFSCQIA